MPKPEITKLSGRRKKAGDLASRRVSKVLVKHPAFPLAVVEFCFPGAAG